MLKRPSYLGSAQGGARDEPGPRGLAGWRAPRRDPCVAPVSSPLARHSRGEALRRGRTLSSGLPEVDATGGHPQLFITSAEHSASICVRA